MIDGKVADLNIKCKFKSCFISASEDSSSKKHGHLRKTVIFLFPLYHRWVLVLLVLKMFLQAG